MAKVRIICISDTHGKHAGLLVPDGDILIHAGDFMTYGNAPREIIDFDAWLGRQSHRHKIVIAGNHDRLFESHPVPARALITNGIYLEDSGVELDGLTFWGSPVQPPFNYWAFNVERGAANTPTLGQNPAGDRRTGDSRTTVWDTRSNRVEYASSGLRRVGQSS